MWSSLAGCVRDTNVGSLECHGAADCDAPFSICGPDGLCVDGCVTNASLCVAGASCDPASGECVGGRVSDTPCTDDRGCDAPDIICRASTGTCTAGCTLSDSCTGGMVCDTLTGRCCDPKTPSCTVPMTMSGCAADHDCLLGQPGTQVCTDGKCVAGCASTGCVAPAICDPVTAHCGPVTCAHDSQCDSSSYCGPDHVCTPVPPTASCSGRPGVPYSCAIKDDAPDFATCVGAPSTVAGCPFCLRGSCFSPGLCAGNADCHGGSDCVSGLCRAKVPDCQVIVPLATVVNGQLAAGKQVCVRDRVQSVKTGYDGMIELKLGSAPYLFADIAPMYQSVGVVIPTAGQTVTLHGTVRWDAGHHDWELLPVDRIDP